MTHDFSQWHMLNTRPKERAQPLTEELLQLGVAVRDMPLLAMHPRDLSVPEIQSMARMAHYDVIVCISPMAVEQGMAWCALQGINPLQQSKWVCVGEQTAQVLRQALCQGKHDTVNPSISIDVPAHSSNEGMLEMPMIASLTAGQSVMIWRGKGGRRLLYESLMARGIIVDSVALYERRRPETLSEDFVVDGDWANVLLISSGNAWAHWQALCVERSVALSRYAYVVLGERVANDIRQHVNKVAVIEAMNGLDISVALSRMSSAV